MKKILISLILVLSLISVVACNKNNEHEHNYEWNIETQPTCTLNGSQLGKCTICGQKARKKISKLDHDYSGEPIVIKEATCEEDGEIKYECQNKCGVPKIEHPSSLGHDFSGEETTIPATCTEKGKRRVKCTKCDKEKVTILNALDHSFSGDGVVTKDPTCEAQGERKFKCTRCDKEVTQAIPALGHIFGDFEVDEASTLEKDGQKSRHCKREGCDGKADITVLPKGKYVEYTVKVKRSNGDNYAFPSELKIQLYQGSEKFGSPYKFTSGVAKFKIEHQPYKVVIEGLRDGYKQKETVTLDRGVVDMNIVVTGSIVENNNEKKPARSLVKGDAMYDFKVRDVNTAESEQKMLSELMKGKKGVYIDFFYVNCGACKQQFPSFVNVYKSFGEKAKDILVILVDVYDETKESINKYKSSYPQEFLATTGVITGSNIYEWVPCPYNGVPFGYFLDSEGVIDQIMYTNTAEAVNNLSKTYTDILTRYLGEPETTSAQTTDFVYGSDGIADVRSASYPVAFTRKQQYADLWLKKQTFKTV